MQTIDVTRLDTTLLSFGCISAFTCMLRVSACEHVAIILRLITDVFGFSPLLCNRLTVSHGLRALRQKTTENKEKKKKVKDTYSCMQKEEY